MRTSARTVGIASTDEERAAIYRFRYQTYVEEQGKKPDGADHENRWLTDELDRSAILLYLERDGEIAGTVRLNQWLDGTVPASFSEWYSLDRFARFPQSSWMFSSYFIVAPRYRCTTVTPRLFCEGFDVAQRRGMRFNFCLAAPQLVGVYSQLGFRRYKENVVTDTVGLRVPMVLVSEDVDHLDAVRSPCAKRARQLSDSDETARWFAGQFPLELGTYDERLHRRQHLAALARFDQLRDATLLAGLEDAQIDDLIAEATFLRCRAGDRVLRRGDAGAELFLILEGCAERGSEAYAPPQRLGPGDFFGEIAFLTQSLRNDNVTAVGPLSLLVFTHRQLLRLMKRDPHAAAAVNGNIARHIALRLRTSRPADAAKWNGPEPQHDRAPVVEACA